MTLKNILLISMLGLSGCRFGSQLDVKELIGKYEICAPEEYLQRNFPNQNPYSALDSFSIEYYKLNESKIKGSTLEIFPDTTFAHNCEILNHKSGTWEMEHIDEMGTYLHLSFSDAGSIFYYEREGYRIWRIPLSALTEEIPLTEFGPRDIRLVYKKINADTRK